MANQSVETFLRLKGSSKTVGYLSETRKYFANLAKTIRIISSFRTIPLYFSILSPELIHYLRTTKGEGLRMKAAVKLRGTLVTLNTFTSVKLHFIKCSSARSLFHFMPHNPSNNYKAQKPCKLSTAI